MSVYSDMHKYLLQVITKERMLDEKQLLRLHKVIFKDTNVHLEEAIKLINSKIRTINLRIDKITSEVTGETMYILYPIVKPHVNAFESSLTPSHKEFISLVFQGIITSSTGSVSTSTAVNYCNSLKNKGIRLIEAEELIDSFMQKKFLMYTNVKKKTHICLTPLCLVELELEFKQGFRDYISDCPLCKRIILQGAVCEKCDIKIHTHCLKSVSLRTKSHAKCPECNSSIVI